MVGDIASLIKDFWIFVLGYIQGFIHDWAFTKAEINSKIMIWFIGSEQDWIPAFKLMHLFYFSRIPWLKEMFRYIINLQKSIKNEVLIKGVYNENERQNKQSSEKCIIFFKMFYFWCNIW